jgi:hypothetical protein
MKRHFLVVFDRSAGLILTLREFDNASDALTARFESEHEYKGNRNIEVVVLGASSIDALKRTHSRYFKDAREIAAKVVDAFRQADDSQRRHIDAVRSQLAAS